MRRILLTLICAAALAACGSAASSTSAPGNGSGGSTSPTVSTGTTTLGTVLTDARGMTLYYFLPEKSGTLGACTGGCLTVWPPLTVSGSPSAASAVTGTLGVVSVTVNGAATSEVTYNGWPLHTYSGDSGPGQTNGQGIENMWFAAEPATTASETGATGASGTAPASTPTSTPIGGNGY